MSIPERAHFGAEGARTEETTDHGTHGKIVSRKGRKGKEAKTQGWRIRFRVAVAVGFAVAFSFLA